MGYKAHVCTTYKVRYDSGSFNHKIDELERLLNCYTFREGENGSEIPLVKSISDDGASMELSPDGLKQLVDDLIAGKIDSSGFPFADYCQAEVAAIFEAWLDSYDKSNDFIRIEWF